MSSDLDVRSYTADGNRNNDGFLCPTIIDKSLQSLNGYAPVPMMSIVKLMVFCCIMGVKNTWNLNSEHFR